MSLTSVATPIWNEIAKEQSLASQWARRAFKLDPDRMAELDSQEYRETTLKVRDPAVASAFLDLKPLLLENRAISRICNPTRNCARRSRRSVR